MASVAAKAPPAVAAKQPAASGGWPATPPTGAINDDDPAMPTRPGIAIPPVARPRPASVMPVATAPITVIPVPALPTVRGTANATRLAPVVRKSPAQQAESARRFAKGTGPFGPAATTTAAMSDDTTQSLGIGDHTRLGVAPASAVGDQTQVGIALPPAARAVELPSVKRRLLSR